MRADRQDRAIETAIRLRQMVCCGVLVLVPLLAYWPDWSGWLTINPMYTLSGLTRSTFVAQGALPGYPYINASAGVMTQALGALAAHDWLHGIVPWWNPYSGIGLPLAGEMQPSAFFLPFILLLLLPGGFLWMRISQQIIGGGATFALLRQLGLGRGSALLGGVFFELNGVFAWVAHTPMLPVAFLPLLLLGVERSAAAAWYGRDHGWRWTTVAVAYSVFAGVPEVAQLNGLLAIVWAVWRGSTLPRYLHVAFLRKIAIGALLGLLISAPLLVSFWGFLPDAQVGDQIGLAQRTLVSPNAAMLLIPYIAGTVGGHLFWFYLGGYIGLALFFLALLSVLRPPSGATPRLILAGWFVVTFAKAIDLPGIGWLINQIPLFDVATFPNYIAASWSLAAAVLAALAVEDWWHGQIRPRNVLIAAIGTALVTVVTLIAGGQAIGEVWAGGNTERMVGLISLVWAIALLAGLALLCWLRPSAARRAWLSGLLLVDAIAMFTVPLLAGVPRQPIDYATVDFLQDHLDLGRFYAIDSIAPNYGAMFGLASVNYNYLPNARAWVDHVQAALDPQANAQYFPGRTAALSGRLLAYEALGVRYVLVPRDANPGVGVRVFRGSITDVYALSQPAPYFEAIGGSCRLDATGRETVRADCQSPATLVRRELFLPGWSAVAGDQTVPVIRRDNLFQAVALPAGVTQVHFTYRPPWTNWATVGFLLGMIGFCGSFVPPSWRKRALPR